MGERRRPRTVSTGTWEGLSVDARAELHTSADELDRAERAVLAHCEVVPGHEQALRVALGRVMRASFLAGAEREEALRVAAETEHAIRIRLELVLREHGIPVPTDPRPSEPPGGET